MAAATPGTLLGSKDRNMSRHFEDKSDNGKCSMAEDISGLLLESIVLE
jgi:hypothetical protein